MAKKSPAQLAQKDDAEESGAGDDAAAEAPAASVRPRIDLDRLRQAIGKRVANDQPPTTGAQTPFETPAITGVFVAEDSHAQAENNHKTLPTAFAEAFSQRSTLNADSERLSQTTDEALPEFHFPTPPTATAPSDPLLGRLEEHRTTLAETLITKARQGDMQALALCVERLSPPAQHSGVPALATPFELPELDSPEAIREASQSILQAAARGELPLTQARELMALLETHWRITEGGELTQRLNALEQTGRFGGSPQAKRQRITLGAFEKPF